MTMTITRIRRDSTHGDSEKAARTVLKSIAINTVLVTLGTWGFIALVELLVAANVT